MPSLRSAASSTRPADLGGEEISSARLSLVRQVLLLAYAPYHGERAGTKRRD